MGPDFTVYVDGYVAYICGIESSGKCAERAVAGEVFAAYLYIIKYRAGHCHANDAACVGRIDFHCAGYVCGAVFNLAAVYADQAAGVLVRLDGGGCADSCIAVADSAGIYADEQTGTGFCSDCCTGAYIDIDIGHGAVIGYGEQTCLVNVGAAVIAGAADGKVGHTAGFADNGEYRVCKAAYRCLLLVATAGVGRIELLNRGVGGAVHSGVGISVNVDHLYKAEALIGDKLRHGAAAHRRKLPCSSDVDILGELRGLFGVILGVIRVLAVVHGVNLRQRHIGVKVEGEVLSAYICGYRSIVAKNSCTCACLVQNRLLQVVDIVDGVFRCECVVSLIVSVIGECILLAADRDFDDILGIFSQGVRSQNGISVRNNGFIVLQCRGGITVKVVAVVIHAVVILAVVLVVGDAAGEAS